MSRLAILAAFVLLAGPAAAQAPTAMDRPPTTSPSSLGGRQFPSGEVERQLRPPADTAAAERDRRQLQELNALSRELTPPGTPVPAPHVEPRQR
ncbi:MAG: hypothetical protein JWP04_623 [Belnapia sp.]|jgi:hypothetical protein|nr:hypothetical protein [Belnapia sp.]